MSLKSLIKDFTERVKHLETPSPQLKPSFADMVRVQELDNSESTLANTSKSNDKPGTYFAQNQARFNIVVYGVKECASGTNQGHSSIVYCPLF